MVRVVLRVVWFRLKFRVCWFLFFFSFRLERIGFFCFLFSVEVGRSFVSYVEEVVV